MRLTADYDAPLVTAADDDDGPVRGTAVPYGVFGRTSAGPVAFEPGSLTYAGDGDDPVPFLLDHDTTRPIGVVSSWEDTPDALLFAADLDPVPAARDARAQMRSRSRRGVSVGVDVQTFTDTPDGMRVTAGRLFELSSVVLPAFTTAAVAASDTPTPDPEGHRPMHTDTDAPPVDVAAATKTKDADADAPATVPDHLRNASVAPTRVPRTIEAFAAYLTDAVRAGDVDTSRDLSMLLERAESLAVRAALTDVTRTDAPPVPTYLTELDNLVLFGMPTVTAFTVRDTTSWPVKQRQVKTWPTSGTKQTAEKSQIPTSATAFEYVDLPDATYAHGNDVSLQAIEDAGEQILADIFEVTSEIIANDINADALSAIDAAAQAGPATGPTLANIGTALGAVVGSGRGNPVIVCAPDVWGDLWAETAGGGPAIARLAGLDQAPTIVPDSQIAAGVAYVGARGAFRTHLSPFSRLRAVAVSLLGLDVGTYRRAAFRVVDAQALVKVTSS